MTNAQIAETLQANIDARYGEFHGRLVSSGDPILGVRIPVLRKLAGDILKSDAASFLNTYPVRWHEERMLRSFVIAGLKGDLSEKLKLVASFVPQIDNWAVCDCFVTTLKGAAKNQEEFWKFTLPYLDSPHEYQVRFAVIMMMCYFLNDTYIDRVLALWSKIDDERYYVQMGVAWGLATAVAKQRDKTIKMILSGAVADGILKKTAQKCRDSFRVTPQDKALITEFAAF